MKRVLLIAAAILAARKLSGFDGGKRVPATVAAISDAAGRCLFHGLPQGARVHFDVDDQRFAHINEDQDFSLNKTDNPVMLGEPIILVPAASISGTLVSIIASMNRSSQRIFGTCVRR